MNKEPSLISMHPFFQKFVFSVIQNIRKKNFKLEGKMVVDTDLVPRISERVMMASMGTNTIPHIPSETKIKPSIMTEKKDMSELVAPIESHAKNITSNMKPGLNVRNAPSTKPVITATHPKPQLQIQRPRPMPMPNPRIQQPKPRPIPTMPKRPAPTINPIATPTPIPSSGTPDNEKYGKIAPLLNDPSVSTIECLGKDKELMIVRAGQKQRTRITLSNKDIKDILDKVAEEAHVPLIEGVFRASVTGFSISAVISEMVGSRFIIKKATAYGLLE